MADAEGGRALIEGARQIDVVLGGRRSLEGGEAATFREGEACFRRAGIHCVVQLETSRVDRLRHAHYVGAPRAPMRPR